MSKRRPGRWWTTAEVRIVRACLPHCTYAEIGSYLNRSGTAVDAFCQRLGLNNVARGIGHKTGRRKGDPRNKLNCPTGSQGKPIGTEVVTPNGVLVAMGKAKWKRKAVILWEQSGRTIPKGHLLIHLDRDKLNCDLSNLATVTRAEHMRRNQTVQDKPARYAKMAATRRKREAYKRAKAVYVDPYFKRAA